MTREHILDKIMYAGIISKTAAEVIMRRLCAAIPGFSEVLAGTATIVPNEPTRDMNNAGAYVEYHQGGHTDDVYEAMLAASPYARSKT
jgi:hypothetical protein